jgi:hypothetical protein
MRNMNLKDTAYLQSICRPTLAEAAETEYILFLGLRLGGQLEVNGHT